jgi:NADH-quinone oxidoreductase subunit J
MYETVAFYIFAALTIASFSVTVTTKNSLYALSTLASGMIFIAGFFFLLDAEFLGVVQIVVYTGAVMALYAFGMMFFDSTRDIKEKIKAKKIIYTLAILSAVFIFLIVAAPLWIHQVTPLYPPAEGMANANAVGMVLFTKYLVPFEAAAVMLLVAMIAGIVLVSKKMDNKLTVGDEFDNEIEIGRVK